MGNLTLEKQILMFGGIGKNSLLCCKAVTDRDL